MNTSINQSKFVWAIKCAKNIIETTVRFTLFVQNTEIIIFTPGGSN